LFIEVFPFFRAGKAFWCEVLPQLVILFLSPTRLLLFLRLKATSKLGSFRLSPATPGTRRHFVPKKFLSQRSSQCPSTTEGLGPQTWLFSRIFFVSLAGEFLEEPWKTCLLFLWCLGNTALFFFVLFCVSSVEACVTVNPPDKRLSLPLKPVFLPAQDGWLSRLSFGRITRDRCPFPLVKGLLSR